MGEYLPKMILKDPAGCQVPILGLDTIRIYGVNAKFGMNQQVVCDSGIVFFRDSSVSNDLITDYLWTFGDGSTSTSQNPSHMYHSTGNYPIGLIVTTKNHCKDTVDNIAPLKIVQSPLAGIAGDTAACVPAQMNFNGLLLNGDTSALRWSWDFGNGGISNLQTPPSVTYPIAGTYNVRMILTNSSNCVDTSYYPVVAHALPIIDAGPDQVICRFQSFGLTPSGGSSYAWRPSSDLSCTNCSTPVATPDSTNRYFVTGKSIFGCEGSDSVLIRVKQPFSINTGPGDTLCIGEFHGLSVNGAELYTWSPVIGLDNPISATPKANPDSSTTYRVIGRDDHNCFTDTGYVAVVVYPYPKVEAGKDQTIGVGSSITISPLYSNDIKDIQWWPNKWLSCADCPSPVASPKQTTTYQVRGFKPGRVRRKG